MEEMTAKTGSALLKAELKRLQEFMHEAVRCFREGEDASGMESFLSAVEGLDQAVEIDQNSLQPKIDLIQLLPAVRGLHFYINNQDITGIADLLEDTFYPLTEEWLKGCDDV